MKNSVNTFGEVVSKFVEQEAGQWMLSITVNGANKRSIPTSTEAEAYKLLMKSI